MSTPKKTVTVDTIAGAGARALATALASINTATATLAKVATEVIEGEAKVAEAEDKLAALKVEYSEKARAAKVELDLGVKADLAQVVAKYANENNKTIVDSAVAAQTQKDLDTLKENFDTQLKSEVAKGIAIATTQHKNEVALKESEFKAQEAENKARISSLEAQLVASSAEVSRLWAALEAERNAGVQRQQAGSIHTMNVGQPTGR